jgi:hypothetical protein
MTCKYIPGMMLIVLLSAIPGCKRFVDTPLPSNQIVPEVIFTNDATATSVLLGAYALINNIDGSKNYYTDLFSDDIYMPNAGSNVQIAQENTYSENSNSFQFFENYYKAIFTANSILEALQGQTGVTDSTAKLLKGESEFIRAYCHFQLVNFYGTPPLITTTNVKVSAYVGNTPTTQIYASIISDLLDAYNLVGTNYPGSDRVRANKSAVSALLAKAYLYKKDWVDAETEATRQINNATYSLSTDLTTVFVKGSTETIWQLWSSTAYTSQGSTYIPANTATVIYTLRPGLLAAFEASDKRYTNWVRQGTGASASFYYPYKYRQRTTTTGATIEYQVQLRLAEQYLIRAEARAQQNNVTGGVADLNVIRTRAGLPNSTAATASALLLAIEQERRIELMVESSNRWFDLNRTSRTAYWLAPQKPTWIARDTLLPYPTYILLANPNLHQTVGY